MTNILTIPGFVYDPEKQRYFPLNFSSKLKQIQHKPSYSTCNAIPWEKIVRFRSLAYRCRRIEPNVLLHNLRKHSFEFLSYKTQATTRNDLKRLKNLKGNNHGALKHRLDVRKMEISVIDQVLSCLCVTHSHLYFLTLSTDCFEKKKYTSQWGSPASVSGSLFGCISPNKTMVAGVATGSQHQIHTILMTLDRNDEDILTLPNEYIHGCCLENAGNLFLAGKSLHLYNFEKRTFSWDSKAFQLPTLTGVNTHVTTSQVVSGHREGLVTLWDTRQQKYQESVCISPDRFAIKSILLTSNTPELFVSTVNGCLRRYDLRWSLHREPLQIFPTLLPLNSGSRILGEFGYQEHLGILYLLSEPSSIEIYDCASVPNHSRTFVLPKPMVDDPSSCSTPFFVPPLPAFGLRKTKTPSCEAPFLLCFDDPDDLLCSIYEKNTTSYDWEIMALHPTSSFAITSKHMHPLLECP